MDGVKAEVSQRYSELSARFSTRPTTNTGSNLTVVVVGAGLGESDGPSNGSPAVTATPPRLQILIRGIRTAS